MRTSTALLLACLSSAAAAADVYRWVDDKGVVHYSDKPLAPNDRPASLPQLQTYNHGGTPPGFQPAPAAPAAGAGAAPAAASRSNAHAFAITSPAPDETIRDADGKFTVTVAADLGPGQGVVYYLDGAAENKEPTPSTAFLYARVDRGEHALSAALVDANGSEIERAGPVTIYVKPPAVKK
jgi:hypothetical protein